MSDNVPIILLARWPIMTPWFERQTGLCGPVPVIFSENVTATKEAASEDLSSFKREIAKVHDR